MEHHRRPDGSPPPWEDADGWVVAGADAGAEAGQPGYPPPEPAPPQPWYDNTYGEDSYGGGGAPPGYEPAPQSAPQPYWPGYPAAPPDAGFRWYREVAPGQWVPSDPPVSAYPANGASYPPPPPPQPYAAPPPQPYAPPPPQPYAAPPQQPYAAPQPYQAAPYAAAAPVSAPTRHEPLVDQAPGPWQPPPRHPSRESPLPEPDDATRAEPPERGAEVPTVRLLSWTLCYFLVPVLAYLGWAFTRSETADPSCVDETGARCLSPRGEAIEALVNAGPALAAALFLATVMAIVMRRLTASWRASMVGFAAAVIGTATATVVSGILR